MLVMAGKLLKLCKIGLAATICMAAGSAFAQEITAINFNGDLIGKVIPDGTVVSFDNEVIGNITADSFIVNNKGEIKGGIIPQGVAIGNDNKLLGRVNNDGSVRLPSGKIVGKVLPNALVVDDSYNILGAVLYPGLVYNDKGDTVGRLTGDGQYISMEGQNIGFVSAMGYAYRNIGNGYVLDGKLISAKMVVSPAGEFIGSIAPGGKVTDFEAKVIGKIHANGYAYDENNKVIGKAVSNGYAFDNYGKYLGLVAYNGEVISLGKSVGKLRADDKVINNQNQVIGFKIDIAATATDLKGKYLGRIMPDGSVYKAQQSVGTVSARGFVKDNDGKIIGQVIKAGPVFDYLADLQAQILRSGAVISVTGTPLGYAKGKIAYDNIGRIIGAAPETVLIFDNSSNFVGLSGIGAEFSEDGINKFKVSPFGYVYSADNLMVGNSVPLSALYTEAGELSGYIGVNAELQGVPTEKNYTLTAAGLAVDAENKVVAGTLNPYFAVSADGQSLGSLTEINLITDEKGNVSGKIVPGYKVVSAASTPDNKQMPVIGGAGQSFLAAAISGDMLGYADVFGTVRDFAGNTIGSVLNGDVVADTNKSLIGKISNMSSVVNNKCAFLGVVGPRGEIRNSRGVVLGKILTNGQAVSEVGNMIGFGVKTGIVTDFAGKGLGTVNPLGRLLNYNHEDLGCVTWNGRYYNNDGKYLGRMAEVFPVIDFENNMLGRSNMLGKVISSTNKELGYMQPDDTALSSGGEVLGMAFRYKVAFNHDNSFLGRITSEGTVISDKNDILGQVLADGTVVSDNKNIGYALYDFYVYDDEGNTLGYLTRDGVVVNFAGNRIGKADKGFLVSKDYNLIGRGNRDYFIRDANNNVIGELRLNGDVIGNDGKVIGKISGSGEVSDENGKVLALAKELQYYNVVKPSEPKPADWANTPRRDIGSRNDGQGGSGKINIGAVDVPQGSTTDDTGKYGLKTIGIALTPDGNYLGDILINNDVVDKLGNLIGKKMPDGLIVDNEGGLIGIEEVKDNKGGQMFIPAGTFGSGGAYGTGNNPSNLGPGGGFGPGERYDPVRAAALAAAQAARRQEITVGKVSTNADTKSFDGMQPYWDGIPRQISSWRVDMSEMILADKPIPAVLARTIMSSNGSDSAPVTAIVERNVYAEQGRNIVIPAGSRVMGTSSGGSSGGNSGGAVRVSITWNRLIRPDGSAFEFSSAQTGDAQGRGGAIGYLDEQLLKKYTLPMVTTLMSSAVAYIAASGETSTSSDGSTTSNAKAEAAQDARQNFLQNMDDMFNQILQDKTNIEAVTYVPAGTRLIIYPKEDLWIRTAARSQEEALDALNKPTVLIDDRAQGSSGGNSGGGNSSGTGTAGGTQGVVYMDNEADNVQPTTPLIDDSASSNNKKRRAAAPAIPPVTSVGATPPPSSTAGSTNTSAQLF